MDIKESGANLYEKMILLGGGILEQEGTIDAIFSNSPTLHMRKLGLEQFKWSVQGPPAN